MDSVTQSTIEKRWWRRVYGAFSPPSAVKPSSTDDLKVSAESYRAIVDTAVDAIVVTDDRGCVRSFNHGAETIFGYPADEVIGKNIRMLMPDPNQSQHDQYLDNYNRTGQRKIIGIGREVEGLRKDGSLVPLGPSIAEWVDSCGKTYFTGILHDITHRRDQETRLQNAIEAAEQARLEAESANTAKTDFLAMMSHEIRTPLTGISGFIDLLSRTPRLSREQRRYIELVRIANSALLTIVNDILDFSKVEAGQMQLDERSFALTTLIHDTLAIVHPAADAKNLRLSFNVHPNVPSLLRGDELRLRQILLNLLNNAVKFTEKGSIKVTVRSVPGAERRNLIKFWVVDTGIGIPVEQQHRLFKRFSQADGSVTRRHGGTGLGLAISKRLVELMGGEIGLESKVGKGTRTWFTVDLAAEVVPDQRHSPEAAIKEAQNSSGRILVVDDIDTNREIVQAYLEDAGYDVETAGSADEAIVLLRAGRHDLVLMDVQMPVMDGVTATRIIRATSDGGETIPIIALSGNVLPQQIRAFLDAGMNDHIGKPIERARLYSTIRRWLPKHDAGSPSFVRDPFSRVKLGELLDILGPARVEMTITRLRAELVGAFRSEPQQSRQEAHDFLNTLGVLGLQDLVDCCRRLDTIEDASSADFEVQMDELRRARDLALRIIDDEIMPSLATQESRRSA